MPQGLAAAALPWVRRAVAGLLVGGLLWGGARPATLVAAGPARGTAAQEPRGSGLTPDWDGGTLTVRGAGFQARERVTLVATVGQAQQTFTVDADGAGRFTLRTGLRVPTAGGVKLDARGGQGTEMAAITSGPLLPLGAGESGPDDGTAGPAPERRGVALALAILAAAALAVGGVLGWRVRARARRAR